MYRGRGVGSWTTNAKHDWPTTKRKVEVDVYKTTGSPAKLLVVSGTLVPCPGVGLTDRTGPLLQGGVWVGWWCPTRVFRLPDR